MSRLHPPSLESVEADVSTTPVSRHAWIAAAATCCFLALRFAASDRNANYRFAFLFLVPIVWGVFWARRSLHLHPFHFALLAAALVLHNLGALGAYQREFVALAFDTYVHFFFGFVGGLILERALREGAGLRGPLAWVAVVLILLGIGAIHELVELGSTLVLGDSGMYKVNDSDPLDTHKDLLNNLLGCLLALSVSRLHARLTRPRTR